MSCLPSLAPQERIDRLRRRAPVAQRAAAGGVTTSVPPTLSRTLVAGTGQMTREAAGMASKGMALGVDVDEAVIARARALTDPRGPAECSLRAGRRSGLPVQGRRVRRRDQSLWHHVLRRPARGISQRRASDAAERAPHADGLAGARQQRVGGVDRPRARPAPRAIGSRPRPILARRASDGSPRVGFTAVTLTAVDVPVFYGRDVDAALD
jgi:hypothetical protein